MGLQYCYSLSKMHKNFFLTEIGSSLPLSHFLCPPPPCIHTHILTHTHSLISKKNKIKQKHNLETSNTLSFFFLLKLWLATQNSLAFSSPSLPTLSQHCPGRLIKAGDSGEKAHLGQSDSIRVSAEDTSGSHFLPGGRWMPCSQHSAESLLSGCRLPLTARAGERGC